MTPTDTSLQALSILRDTSHFSWYVIPFLLITIYVYMHEADKGNWSRVLAGLAFWGMDWFNEIINGLVFHFTQYAPLWAAPADTAYLVFIGLNIEIVFMFAITGIVATMALPLDKNKKVLGINNRLFIASLMSALSVCVEMVLNAFGALTWEWSLWNHRFPLPIFLFGYLTFYLVCFWVYDMEARARQIKVVAGMYAGLISAVLVFGFWLKWI